MFLIAFSLFSVALCLRFYAAKYRIRCFGFEHYIFYAINESENTLVLSKIHGRISVLPAFSIRTDLLKIM